MMTTENMNRVELSNNEQETIFGGGFLYNRGPGPEVRCKHCGKWYYAINPHKCPPVFPKMDVDNRPAITPPVFHPELHQA